MRRIPTRRRSRRLRLEQLEGRELLSVTFVERATSISVEGGYFDAADMDADGDIDIVYAGDSLGWYENTDGKGRFERHVITERTGGFTSISGAFAADFDGDGDMDILSMMATLPGRLPCWEGFIRCSHRIDWYENTGGNGAFTVRDASGRLFTGHKYNLHISPADIDGDSDIDILVDGDTQAWLENDGAGTLGDPREITCGNGEGGRSLHAADFDGDNDLDVLTSGNDGMEWCENIDGRFGGSRAVSSEEADFDTADLDSDGDIDILVETNRGRIAWHENTDGQGTFREAKELTQGRYRIWDIQALDVDGDGDTDFLAAEQRILWYENMNGEGLFTEPQYITFEESHILAAGDFDGDGDVDVATDQNDRLVWYKQVQLDALGAGDANRDGEFDQLDLIRVLEADKYNKGGLARWSEGDWNGDGLFNQLDIVAALQTGNYMQGPYMTE